MLKKLLFKWSVLNRARRIKKHKKKLPPYLLKDFEVELNYKLWSTKGTRFSASYRNYILNKLSSKSIGFLSAYLIIVNLVNIYGLSFWKISLTNESVAFISTAISILILLFSQLENSENFILNSERFHNCALDIAELYNRLRFLKSFGDDVEVKKVELRKISDEYDLILKKYENHLPIDYKVFQLTKPEYFELNRIKCLWIRVKFYLQIKFKYHVLIFGPIVIFIILNLIK